MSPSTRLDQDPPDYDGDIIGSLPFEILLQIVEYLDPADIIQSQRVSKQWRGLFSSEKVIGCVLRLTLEILGLEDEEVATKDAMTYFEWRHRLQHGRPVKKFFFAGADDSGEPIRERKQYHYMYAARRLCYLKYTSNLAVLYHFDKDRQQWPCVGYVGEEFEDIEDRENAIWSSFLADRVLLIVCRSRDQSLLTAVDLQTKRQRIGYFPSGRVSTFIDKDKVALLVRDTYSFLIYIWDITTNKLQNIGPLGDVTLVHMDADRNMVVIFEIDWHRHPTEVQQTKWKFNGQLLDRKQFPLSPSGRGRVPLDEETRPPLTRQFRCCRNFGHKSVTRVAFADHENVVMDLIYDSTIDKLSARWIDHDLPPNTNLVVENPFMLLTPYISYYYHGVLNRLHICNTANGTSRIYPYQQDCQEVTGGQRVVFGDREVLCVHNDDGIQLWCFNPNFVLDLLEGKCFFLPKEESG